MPVISTVHVKLPIVPEGATVAPQVVMEAPVPMVVVIVIDPPVGVVGVKPLPVTVRSVPAGPSVHWSEMEGAVTSKLGETGALSPAWTPLTEIE